MLGRAVCNDQAKRERIGNIDDITTAPDKAACHVIINADGFVGAFKCNPVLPSSQSKEVGGKLVLPGATREALKASPAFEYSY